MDRWMGQSGYPPPKKSVSLVWLSLNLTTWIQDKNKLKESLHLTENDDCCVKNRLPALGSQDWNTMGKQKSSFGTKIYNKILSCSIGSKFNWRVTLQEWKIATDRNKFTFKTFKCFKFWVKTFFYESLKNLLFYLIRDKIWFWFPLFSHELI